MLTPFDETLATAGLFLIAEDRKEYESVFTFEGDWGRIWVTQNPIGWDWTGHNRLTGYQPSAPVYIWQLDRVHQALRRLLKPE